MRCYTAPSRPSHALARERTSFDAVYASDLARARATAELALPGHALRTDPRIRELDYGAFEGHRWSDMGRSTTMRTCAIPEPLDG